MNRRDIELMAALAEGRLEDESEARALVESSLSHRSEYEAQKTAFEALASLGSAGLTERESAELRRNVWSELRNQPAAAPVGTPWPLRLSYGLGGLLLVVGLVAVLNQGDRSVETFSEIGSSLDGGGAPALSGEEAPESDTTNAAGAPLADESFFLATADAYKSGRLDLQGETAVDDAKRAAATSCLDRAGLTEHEVAAEIGTEQTYYVVVMIGDTPETASQVHFVDTETCEEVYSHMVQP